MSQRPRDAKGARREEGRRGKSALDLADNDLRIAENVRPDLHHRRPPVASRQRRQVGPRHDARNAHGFPGEALEPEDEANLLRERGLVEMVQNDRMLHDKIALRICGEGRRGVATAPGNRTEAR